jgi:hypothetical protein
MLRELRVVRDRVLEPLTGRHLGRLEMHVTHACNLACESCSHYSNHSHSGNLELAEAEAWMSAWRRRFSLGELILLGGEPTIHPQLPEFVRLARRCFPRACVTVVSNGFFLKRQPDLPRALAEIGNAQLYLSVHHDAADYLARLQPGIDLAERWRSEYGVRVRVRNSFDGWERRYHGFGAAMLPYEDENPRKSWEICTARRCRQLFDGKLWKCSPVAYLRLQAQKYRLSDKWDRYLAYEPLSPDCSDKALADFLRAKEEDICAMCPATLQKFRMPNPLRSNARPTT